MKCCSSPEPLLWFWCLLICFTPQTRRTDGTDGSLRLFHFFHILMRSCVSVWLCKVITISWHVRPGPVRTRPAQRQLIFEHFVVAVGKYFSCSVLMMMLFVDKGQTLWDCLTYRNVGSSAKLTTFNLNLNKLQEELMRSFFPEPSELPQNDFRAFETTSELHRSFKHPQILFPLRSFNMNKHISSSCVCVHTDSALLTGPCCV